jgi:NADH-quinone oxidoreductase subunit E
MALLGEDCEHVTPDGVFTLEEEECLAACDKAPVMALNYVFFDAVTEDALERMIASIRAGQVPAASRGGVPGELKEISRALAGLTGRLPDAPRSGDG